MLNGARKLLSFRTSLLGVLCATTAACGSTAEAPDEAARLVAEATARLEASDGGQVVLRGINAAGGLDAWYSAPTSAYGWEYANVGSNLQFKSHLVADNASRRMYHRLVSLGDYQAAEPIEGRFAWDGTDAWIWPADIERVNARFWASTGYYFSSIPFVLADPGITYEVIPDEELDGVVYDMVKVGYEAGVGDASDTYTLYVDKETDRVRAIRYTVTFGGRPARGETLFYYDDYVTVSGLTVPTHFVGHSFVDGQKGDFRNEAFVTDISFSEPFDESQLEMPEGGRIQPMPGS
jgi:hypothetical protein